MNAAVELSLWVWGETSWQSWRPLEQKSCYLIMWFHCCWLQCPRWLIRNIGLVTPPPSVVLSWSFEIFGSNCCVFVNWTRRFLNVLFPLWWCGGVLLVTFMLPAVNTEGTLNLYDFHSIIPSGLPIVGPSFVFQCRSLALFRESDECCIGSPVIIRWESSCDGYGMRWKGEWRKGSQHIFNTSGTIRCLLY